jgi:transposase
LRQFFAPAPNLAGPRLGTAPQRIHARRQEYGFRALVVVAIGAILCRRWQQMGAYVTGPDPGNWFAYGRGLFGGPGKSTGGVYPPLVPFLLHGAQWFFDPMNAAKLVGIGSLAAVMAATLFVALHGMNRWLALAVALGVGLSAEVTETLAFGGYPQNYGFAFLLVAAAGFAGYLQTFSRRWLVLGGSALAGAALSHHVYYLLACLVVALIWLIWLAALPGKRCAVRATVSVIVASVPSLLFFLPTFLALWHDGYGAPLGASGMDAQTALRQAIIDARWLWIPTIATGSVYIAFTFRPRRPQTWAVAAALLLATVLFFPATGEIRLIPPLIAGALLSSGLALEDLRKRSHHSIWAGTAFTAAAVFVILLYPLSDANAAKQYQYYRVADRSLLDATAWVAAHADQHRFVVREDGRGWPVGWWFEGLTRASIVVGSEPRWLAFPRERSNSALAGRFFDQQLSVADLRALAVATNVRYLVFRKDWSAWPQWTAKFIPPFSAVYDDGEFTVVDLRAD